MEEINELDNNIKRDSIVSMCGGLRKRTAFSVKKSKYVHANVATKEDGPFYCPECLSDAIVRKCIEKDDHFAHKANLSKILKNSETKLHKDCKLEILESLRNQFPDGNWMQERLIPENKEKKLKEVIPDISGRINNQPIAIEVQRSFLNIRNIIKRTEQYTKRGVAILWLIPLKEDLPIENFRPRLFERFIHDMYFGKIFYWKSGFGSKVQAVHFGIKERYIQESTFFDSEIGEEVTFGGHMKAYKTIKQPLIYSKLLNIGEDFQKTNAKSWTTEYIEYEVPNRIIFNPKVNKWW